MPDIKTIMSWLEGLAESDWRMFHSDSEVQTIAKETLALLKEREPMKPVLVGHMWECGNCHAPVGIYLDDIRDDFCRKCGRAVKWE